jgi:Ion channel
MANNNSWIVHLWSGPPHWSWWVRRITDLIFWLSLAALTMVAFVPRAPWIEAIGTISFILLAVAWLNLVWWIFERIFVLYAGVEKPFSRLKLICDLLVGYFVVIYAFAIGYLLISRADKDAFGFELGVVSSIYFSVVAITTTGFGDISPKTSPTMAMVGAEVLFGYFYAVLFFSTLAGLATLQEGSMWKPRR